MCWEGQSKFPGPNVTSRWMCVLLGRVWSFSCLWMYVLAHGHVLCLLHHLLPPQPLNSSWTEDTRSSIFSDTALHLGRDGQKPLAAELDMQIEQKFEEFDTLAATGKNILDKEHHLTQMVSRGTHFWPSVIVEYIVGYKLNIFTMFFCVCSR